MVQERVIGAISSLEAQRENIQYLEGAIPALSRQLLYGSPQPEEEVLGYSYLRSLATHPDLHIKNIVGEALNKRWDKVGFYERHVPSKRFPSIDDINRPTYDELSRGIYSLSDEDKVSILELARRFSNPDARPISAAQLEIMITPLLGPQTQTQKILEKLKELYLLTDEGQYTPLIETSRGKLRLGSLAHQVLTPHIPALEAISYPEAAIPAEEVETIKAVGNSTDLAFRTGMIFFSQEDISDSKTVEDNLIAIPDLAFLDLELKDEERATKEREKISFLDEQGRLYTLVHSRSSSVFDESITISLSEQPFGVRERLLLDWGGRIVRGEDIGNINLQKDRNDITTIVASGALLPQLPMGLEGVQTVSVSKQEITFEWNDLSSKGRHGGLELKFCTPYKITDPFSKYARTAKHVAGSAWAVTVQESTESKSHKRKGEFGGSRSSWREILLEKPEEILQIKHPHGSYTLKYEVADDTIKIVVTGKGWENVYTVPRVIDPFTIAQTLEHQVRTVVQLMQDKKDLIQSQVRETHRLSLTEQDILSKLIQVEDPEIRKYLEQRLTETELHAKLRLVDEGLSNLSYKDQRAVMFYIFVLAEGKQRDTETETPRAKLQSMINEYGLNIPERLLDLCESIFSSGQSQTLP